MALPCLVPSAARRGHAASGQLSFAECACWFAVVMYINYERSVRQQCPARRPCAPRAFATADDSPTADFHPGKKALVAGKKGLQIGFKCTQVGVQGAGALRGNGISMVNAGQSLRHAGISQVQQISDTAPRSPPVAGGGAGGGSSQSKGQRWARAEV